MKAPPTRVGRESGFTLVEMLVAVLLFGIIASVATALTASATRSFASTDTALAAVQDIEAARAVMAADFGQASARPSLAADGRVMPAFLLLPEGFVLVRRRPGDALPGIEKVAWGLADGSWSRQPFPAVDGAGPGDAVAMVPGVAGVRLRVAGADGWQDQWRPSRPEALPRAVEVTLLRHNGMAVVMKFLVAA